MVKALENIFGGEPTLSAYDGTGQYSAFIDGVGGGSYGGGGGGGYVPPVPPNPTYVPIDIVDTTTSKMIKISLTAGDDVVEFLENGVSLSFGQSFRKGFFPASTFSGTKKYEIVKEGSIAEQYYEVSVTKKYQPPKEINTPLDLDIDYLNPEYIRFGGNSYGFDSGRRGIFGFNNDYYNDDRNNFLTRYTPKLRYNFNPKTTAIDYKYAEVLTINEYRLQSDGSYLLDNTKNLDSDFGSVTLNFTTKAKTKSGGGLGDIGGGLGGDPNLIQNLEYEIVFSSNLKNELGTNVILDYTIFSAQENILKQSSISLADGNDIQQIGLKELNGGRVDFKIRYNNLPSNYVLTNIYQTATPSGLFATSEPDYNKWNKQASAFSVSSELLKTGISIVTLFEKEIEVERPSVEIDDVYKQISVQVKESDDDKNISIPFRTKNADEVLLYIDGSSQVISIPPSNEYISLSFKNDFAEVYGTKKIVLLAKSNRYGTGDSVTTLITFTSVNDFPSITEINFPQNIDVPSFSDFNIEYKVEYTSFSTTTVDVDLLLKDKSRIGLFKNLNPNGEVLINIKTLREKFPNWAGSDNVTLIFKPFNRGGAEELIGNEYEVVTTLGLPGLQLDENIFSSN